MPSSRPVQPPLRPLRNTLVAAAATHGSGLPARWRLLALLTALAITAVSAPFATTADGSDDRATHRPHGFGRYAPFVPLVDEAE